MAIKKQLQWVLLVFFLILLYKRYTAPFLAGKKVISNENSERERKKKKKWWFYLNGQDAVFMNCDYDYTTCVHAVLEVANEMDEASMIKTFETQVAAFDRFHAIVKQSKYLWPYFEEDHEFDMKNHVESITLPEPGSQDQIHQLVEKIMAQGLNPSKPLWKLYCVHNYKKDEWGGKTGSCVIFKFHHSCADGIAILRVMLDVDKDILQHKELVRSTCGSEHADDVKSKRHQEQEEASSSTTSTTSPTQVEKKKKLQPKGMFAIISNVLYSTVKLLALPNDPASIWKPKKVVTNQTVSWLRKPVPLEKVKQIKNKFNCSVNDVLIAAAAGALRYYALTRAGERGKKSCELNLKSVIWVNLRSADEMVSLICDKPIDMGNQIGACYLGLPLNVEDPLERLKTVKNNAHQLYQSAEPVVSNALMNVIGLLPPFLSAPIWKSVAYKVSFSMSSLPGPGYQVKFGLNPLANVVYFVPPQGYLGIFITILTYDNKVQFGIAADKNIILSCESIVARFIDEIDNYLELANGSRL